MEQLFESIVSFIEKCEAFEPIDKSKFYIGTTYNPVNNCLLDISILGYFKKPDLFTDEFTIANYGRPSDNFMCGFHNAYYTIKPNYTSDDIYKALSQTLRPSSEFTISELRNLAKNENNKHKFIHKTKTGSYSYYTDVFIQLNKKQTVKSSKMLALYIISVS